MNNSPLPASRTCNVAGGQLQYWDVGSGRPIIFIHGVGTSGDLWMADLSELAHSCRVIVHNRRGYGGSSASPRDWSAHASDALQLLRTLEATPAVLVGYSGGAIVALDIAVRHPQDVSHLVLVDPAYSLHKCLTPGLLRTIVLVKLSVLLGGRRAAVARWLRYVSSYATGGNAYDDKASDERKEALAANADGVLADLASGSGKVPESRVAQLPMPVTIISAALSPSFLRNSSQRLRRLLPQARAITLPQSGHWIGLEAGPELTRLLGDLR